MGSEMHDGVDVETLEYRFEALTVARIADHEFAMEHGATKPGGQIVQDDDFFTGLTQLSDDVATDITGTSRNENRFMAHTVRKVR